MAVVHNSSIRLNALPALATTPGRRRRDAYWEPWVCTADVYSRTWGKKQPEQHRRQTPGYRISVEIVAGRVSFSSSSSSSSSLSSSKSEMGQSRTRTRTIWLRVRRAELYRGLPTRHNTSGETKPSPVRTRADWQSAIPQTRLSALQPAQRTPRRSAALQYSKSAPPVRR